MCSKERREKIRNACRSLVGKPPILYRVLIKKWEDGIKMDFIKIGFEDADCIELAWHGRTCVSSIQSLDSVTGESRREEISVFVHLSMI
jgi:hypothetical protein